jgi:hypothetical protein
MAIASFCPLVRRMVLQVQQVCSKPALVNRLTSSTRKREWENGTKPSSKYHCFFAETRPLLACGAK